jgi:hypothetical protein
LPLDPKCPAEISGETPENQIKKKKNKKKKVDECDENES